MRPFVLVTGGAGYIGSHTTLALLQAGHNVVVLDNLCNSSPESLRRVAQIVGISPVFIRGDILDVDLLRRVFLDRPISAVIHFAGLKAVGESVQIPLAYYQNNVTGTLMLCQAMANANVHNLVFSSSAAVYGEPSYMPIAETCPTCVPTSPYGRSKLMVEELLADLAQSDASWRIAVLRYFNPVGAHHSGLMGEDSNSIPNNLLPYISQVAIGKLSELSVYGNDYPTPDGTGVRDYIHVMDLASGHLKALDALIGKSGLNIWNLGTGRGYSVMEMLHAFEQASGCPVPWKLAPRRPGDVGQCWADPSKALKDLGWKAERGLSEIMRDAWHWQQAYPDGYR
jgi:UDP-glucose 4-epimerase